jgi:hypothetical protein
MRPLEFRPNERLNILHKDAFTISREEMTERDLWDATCQKERTDVTQKEMFDNNKNRLLRTVFKEKAIMMRLVMRNPLMIDIPITKVRLQCHFINAEGEKEEGEFDATYASITSDDLTKKDYKVQMKEFKLYSRQEQEVILKVSPLREGTIVIDKVSWELYDTFKCEYKFL